MGSNGGARSQVLEASGESVPPAVGVYGETHCLLQRSAAEASEWEHLINSVQTLAALESGRPDTIVGELIGACSEKEMVEKQLSSTTNDLERLRVDSDPEGRYVNPFLAVKSFQRSDASKTFTAAQTRSVVWCRRTADMCLQLQASADLLSVPWLFRTQLGTAYKFLDIYNFLRDRFRALWQDLTIQHADSHQGNIEVLEISCRLLILAEELLCDDPEFNAVQNGNLLSTCLDKLMAAYEAVDDYSSQTVQLAQELLSRYPQPLLERLKEVVVFKSPHEPEFWCYRILLCLSSPEPTAADYVLSKIPPELRSNSLVRLATSAVRCYHGGNPTRYIKLARASPPLVAVIVTKYAELARHSLLATITCDKLKTHASMIPAPSFCRMFGFNSTETLLAYCESVGAVVRPVERDHRTPLYLLSVDVSEVVVKTTKPKESRLKRTPNDPLRRLLNTYSGGRLRLLDPREPYQADMDKLLEPAPLESSGMFATHSDGALPLSKLATHTDSPHYHIPIKPAPAATPVVQPAARIPAVTSQTSPRLGFESLSNPEEVNETWSLPHGDNERSAADDLQEKEVVDKSRKRGVEDASQQVSKKSKNVDHYRVEHDIRDDLRAHVNLYETFVAKYQEKNELLSPACLNAFGPHSVVSRLENELMSPVSLPDPTAVCFSIRVFGSIHSALPAVLDGLMLGTPDTPSLLQQWSMSDGPLAASPAEKFIYRSALWLKEKGHALGAVAIYYTSEREQLMNQFRDAQPSAARPVTTLRLAPGDITSCHSGGGKGCDQPFTEANDDASTLTDGEPNPNDLPCLVFCCTTEAVITRNGLDQKVPWRVENSTAVLEELEKLHAHQFSCRGAVLVWQARLGTPGADVTNEDEPLMAEAVRQCVQKNLAMHPTLQRSLLPLLCGSSRSKNANVPRGSCVVLLFKHKRRGNAQLRLGTLAHGFSALASAGLPSVIWPLARTCSLPFMLLNIWKKEINDVAKPSSEVSELAECLDSGLTKFLRLPYWHEDPVDCRLLVKFCCANPSELHTVRKILKKLKKACREANRVKTKTSKEKEQARKSLNIAIAASKAPARLLEARQVVRAVIRSAIATVEKSCQGTGLLKTKFMLPLPLQLCTQTQHIRPWCDGAGGP